MRTRFHGLRKLSDLESMVPKLDLEFNDLVEYESTEFLSERADTS